MLGGHIFQGRKENIHSVVDDSFDLELFSKQLYPVLEDILLKTIRLQLCHVYVGSIFIPASSVFFMSPLTSRNMLD